MLQAKPHSSMGNPHFKKPVSLSHVAEPFVKLAHGIPGVQHQVRYSRLASCSFGGDHQGAPDAVSLPQWLDRDLAYFPDRGGLLPFLHEETPDEGVSLEGDKMPVRLFSEKIFFRKSQSQRQTEDALAQIDPGRQRRVSTVLTGYP